MTGTPELDPQTVSELAHRLWEGRGRQEGHALEDWVAAESQLLREHTVSSKRPGGTTRSISAKKRANAEPTAKVPNPPELEVDSVPREIPKLGSSDAPGG